MASEDASAPDIMNIREIIEFAFGDFNRNTVNFKLVQTVLFLLARQLRLLDRRVRIELGPFPILPPDSTLAVTEVKIHAAQKTQLKTKDGGKGGAKPGVAGATPGVGRAKQGLAGTKPEAGAGAGVGAGAGTDAGAKRKNTGRGTESSASDKTFTGKTTFTDKTYSGKKTSSGDNTSTDRTTSSGEKTSADTTTSSGEKTSTDRTTSSGQKTSTDRIASSGEKTSTDRTTSSGQKTSTDRTTSSGQKSSTYTTTSSGEKTSTDRIALSGEKTSTDRITSSGEKTSTDRTTSSGQKTSTDRTTTIDKTTSTDKTTLPSTDKPSSKTTSLDRISLRRTTSSSKDTAGGQKPDSYPNIQDTLEEQRERELRIIHQRSDSFEETTKTPTPMASVSSMQYEKLLVVKRTSSTEAKLGESVHGPKRTPQISVVTQEQFNQVADAVRQLEKKLLPVGTPGFPEHAELMEELRRGASLTDAMAALQLSARLEATEKTLANLISMVTELALQTPGLELDSETRALLGISATWQRNPDTFKASEVFEGDPFEGSRSAKSRRGAKESKSMTAPSTETPLAILETVEAEMTQAPPSTGAAPEPANQASVQNRFITYPDLQSGTRQMYDEIIKKLKTITARTTTTAENAYNLSIKLETRLDSALLDNSRMVDLENAVKQYAEQINALDTGLSSQMTNYQEQLTQMQHDLEIGLDTMAEVLGNSGGDTEAVAELHSQFTNLQTEFDTMSFRQQQLKGVQNSTAYDLENLWREIEMLRDTKSDREEVADALRDKAGICELNGLVSIQQFEAVRGDFQKRIRAAYDKFNNQENIWQKAIDDMVKVLNEKADLVQVYSLKDEIHKYLKRIIDRMQIISDIVGEPKSAIVSKKIFRDTLCLSCGSPAHMDVEEPGKVPALPKFPSARQPAEGAEAESQTKGGGDYGICYAALPIPHPRDPRSHICKRYCGGSHTVVTDGLKRALPGLVVLQATRTINAAPGTDGKLYLMDEQTKKIPCLPCNMPQPSPLASESEPQKQAPVDSIDEFENISLTPPAHEISYN